MILVTGGLGFIGSHTAKALLDLGESCVLAQRRSPTPPETFAEEIGTRVFLEQVDVGDLTALLEVGARHKITGVVHLGGSTPWPPGEAEPIDGARAAVNGLLNVFQAAADWQVARVGVASTIGVYGGAVGESPMAEDQALPLAGGHVIPTFKKIGELLTGYLADTTGVEVVNYRISAIWGPGGRPASVFLPTPQLVNAAVRGTAPDFSLLRAPVHAGNGSDMFYVKDCGRAIAMLQLADRLNHRTYNVASGRSTTNGEVVAAIKKVIPDARIELPEGRDPAGPDEDLYLDVAPLRADTGFRPAYDVERAVADHIAWLRDA
jgi:UDP-glucose 4-epimerase